MERLATYIRLAIRLAIIVVVLLIGYLSARFLLGADIVVDVSALDNPSRVVVLVDDAPQLGFNERTKSFKIKDVFGNKQISVRAPGFGEYQTTVRALWRGQKQITAVFTPERAEDIARSLDSGFSAENYEVVDAKYFGVDWLAFRAVSRTNPADNHPLIAYFTRAGQWRVLNYGGEEHEFDISSPNPTIPLPPTELYNEYFQ